MEKWITALSAVTAVVAIGVVIRQISEGLFDNVELRKSATDESYGD